MRWATAMVTSGVLLGALSACVGVIGGGAGNDNGGSDPAGAGAEPESAMFPRLSHAQWENTVRDLLYLPQAPGLSAMFTTDPPGAMFDNNVAKMQVTPNLFGDYQRAADEIAQKVTSDPQALAKLLPKDLPTEPVARARAFVTAFGARAFRRPLSEAEIASYAEIFQRGAELTMANDPVASGAQVTIVAMMQSPHFIYKEEIGRPGADGRVHLTGYELASKLSYALWNTMPDDELFAAAKDGSLESPAGLAARAQKMVDDPRAKPTLASFHATLFKLSQYKDVSKDQATFPKWNPQVGASMKKEAELFVEDVVATRSKGLSDLLTAPYTFVNADLAGVYGLSGSFGAQFTRVDLDPAQRAGILTQSGFLAKNAGLRELDTIHRGVFVNLYILCADLPPPPDMIPPLPAAGGRTNRERVDAHTGKGTCGEGCHGGMINPIGFAFENYDAVGAWRAQDNGKPVDATGNYRFKDGQHAYQNAPELMKVMVARPQTHACYVKHWLEYAYGRDPAPADNELVDAVAKTSLEGGSVKKVLIDLVTSPRFVTRKEVR